MMKSFRALVIVVQISMLIFFLGVAGGCSSPSAPTTQATRTYTGTLDRDSDYDKNGAADNDNDGI